MNNKPDMVNNPPHYTSGDIECIDAIEAALGREGFIAFLRGQVIKYQWRMGLKDDAAQDNAKAIWYANKLAEVLARRIPGIELPMHPNCRSTVETELSECECSMRGKLLGDGCSVCNPELAAEHERYNRPPCLECGAETQEQAETVCVCNGDKDSCHGRDLWPD